MKSIKPGRGPSMMGGFMSIAMAAFGLIWTFMAASMGGGPFALFGVIFIVVAVVQAVYNFKNATGENRYSVFDITDAGEEPDPLDERFGKSREDKARTDEPKSGEGSFCPYCGARVEEDYEFCSKCGKKLP
ncbi:MAG: zinc-ribbon domain-containing protein [Clostridiales bacterium]|nr:zinc-ribbon domain-containing protein [Clostridiales bacterium]